MAAGLVLAFGACVTATCQEAARVVQVVEEKPPQAGNGSPEDGALVVAVDAILSWSVQGSGTKTTFDVYLGTGREAVQNASTGSAEFRGNVADSTFDPGGMDKGTRYYWRVDARKGGG